MAIRTLFSLFLVPFWFPFSSAAQVYTADTVIGQTVTIPSGVLGGERELFISVPDGYDDTTQTYPVLYLLDGQRWHLYGVSLVQLFAEYDYIPEVIVVGIATEDASRFGFFAESETLLQFLEQDVLAFVDQTYRASSERLLLGWQFAGAFTVEALAERPDLFDAYFAASPIPLTERRVQALLDRVSDQEAIHASLFFTTSFNETGVEEGAENLARLLHEHAPATLNWRYQKLEHETIVSAGHRTTPLGTLYHGLRSHYHDYPMFEPNTIEEYVEAGGLAYVTAYYQSRAEKYGLSSETPNEGMFNLIRLSLNENHYPTFASLMDAFADTDFLDQTNLGWSSRFAEFYLQHNDPDGAIGLYEQLVERFPTSARPVNGLGDAYRAKGDVAQAETYYRNAIALAEKTSDMNLEHYQADLDNLMARTSNE